MNEWISVEDRMPPNGMNFIGTDGDCAFVAYWCSNLKRYIVGGWEGCRYCAGINYVNFEHADFNEKRVTHWMPLPNRL